MLPAGNIPLLKCINKNIIQIITFYTENNYIIILQCLVINVLNTYDKTAIFLRFQCCFFINLNLTIVIIHRTMNRYFSVGTTVEIVRNN